MAFHQHEPNPHPAIKTYLVVYNFIQAAGWTLCFLKAVNAYVTGADYQASFLAGSQYARWMQFLAFVEIVHAGTGIVPSSPISNFWQWLGRANALFKFAVGIPEIIRYPWYGLTLLDRCPDWLTWIRYTAFLLLYPVGVVSEMLLLYQGVPYVRDRDLYSIHMPNRWNFAWDYALFIQIMLVLYPYLWWGNFSSLLRQRKKKLGAHKATAAAEAAANSKKEL